MLLMSDFAKKQANSWSIPKDVSVSFSNNLYS